MGAALLILLAVAAVAHPLAGTVAALALTFFMSRASRWTTRIERLFDAGEQVRSQNVVGTRSGAGADPLRIVVMAHLDSKSQRWPTFVPAALIIAAALVVMALGVWCALAAVGAVDRPTASQVVPLAGAAAIALLVGLLNSSGNESPGAMDNASGLAVMLECARVLAADDELARVEFTLLATGAEEIGLAGAMRWIQKHESEYPIERTLFINVDSAGVGRDILAMNVSGTTPRSAGDDDNDNDIVTRPERCSVRETIRIAARGHATRVRFIPSILGIGVDTMPIAARGYATLTLLGEVLGPASRRFHSRRDTIEHLGEEALRSAARLALAIVRTVESRRTEVPR